MHARAVGSALLFSLIACGDDSIHVPPPSAAAGSLVVTWKLVGPEGGEITCTAASFTAFQVRIGAEPIRVECGEPQRIERDRLTPGRYPLVISPEIFQGQTADQYAYRTNLEVRDQEQTTHDASITIDPASIDSGNIDLRWRIEGLPPATQCAVIGATTFRVVSDEGSIDPFELDLPCTAGSHRLEQRRRGDYTLVTSMRDANGAVINSLVRTVDVSVVAGQTTSADVNFQTGTTTLGALDASWTISSSAAATHCADIAGELVEITVLTKDPQQQYIPVATATAACTAGALGIDELPAANFYRVRYDLFDFFGTLISEVNQEPVAFLSTRTTTTAVDFRVR